MKNGKNVIHYIQPKYYKNFACIGNDCPQNCCFGWNIDWTKDEVEKLKSANCSDDFKELINRTFIPKEGMESYAYIVEFGETGYCPLQDENGLCRVQKELGVDYMSKICMIYPRSEFKARHFVSSYCHLSCIHVIDMLLNDSHSMELERRTKTVSENQEKQILPINEELLQKHPELNYARQIFELYYDIISNESHSLETSVNYGSYASIRLTEIVNKGKYEFIPEAIQHIREDVSNKDLSDKLEAIKPNYDIKLKFVIYLQKLLGRDVFNDIIIDENTVDIEKFKEGERRFNEAFADRQFALRNVALGLLMDLNIPFRTVEKNIFDNYCYFIASFVIAKLIGPAVFLKNTSQPELEYKKAIALFNRSFAHSDEGINLIVDLLKQFRCDVPANLSAIIK